MTDIVERLRHWSPVGDASVFAPVVEAAAVIEALRAENARLREALKPFAKRSDELHSGFDDSILTGSKPMVAVFVSDLRAARAAIGENDE